MGPLMWCPCIIGVGRRGGRVEGLEGVGVSMSESVYDGGIAGSAQRDSFLPVVGVGVGESVYDGGGAGSAQRDDVFSVLGVRTSESVYDGGGAGSAQRDLPIVEVGVLDGVTAYCLCCPWSSLCFPSYCRGGGGVRDCRGAV